MIAARAPHVVEDIRIHGLRLSYPFLDDPDPAAERESGELFLAGPFATARKARAALVIQNASRIRVTDLAIEWPRYPVTEPWFLFESPQQVCNAPFWDGRAEEIRAGIHRPRFHAFWLKNVREGHFQLDGLTDSEGGDPTAQDTDEPGLDSCREER
jgi:hypothetical protein